MIDAQSIQWFPGHMAKTRRLMAANLKMVDIVVEITDARIPQSSRNPEIDRMLGQKPRLILLNKCDVADPTSQPGGVNTTVPRGFWPFPPTARAVGG